MKTNQPLSAFQVCCTMYVNGFLMGLDEGVITGCGANNSKSHVHRKSANRSLDWGSSDPVSMLGSPTGQLGVFKSL